MSVKNKILLEGMPFTYYKERQIDESTLIDLLGVVIYEASRSSVLDEIGIEDHGVATHCILGYVLDALGVPPEGEVKRLSGEHVNFNKECCYSRTPYYEIVYGIHSVEYGQDQPSAEALLSDLKNELNNKQLHYL